MLTDTKIFSVPTLSRSFSNNLTRYGGMKFVRKAIRGMIFRLFE
jgi:hypothetical protein